MATCDILNIENIQKHFVVNKSWLKKGKAIKAVEKVSLNVQAGETLAIVGESGSGKSTLARLIMGLLEPTNGKVFYKQSDINQISALQKKQLCQDIQFIFQDPFSSLNPTMTVGALIKEPLKVHKIGTKETRETRVKDLMRRVGLQPDHANRFPHEFSGGQRQRIAIARALAVNPKIIIADEPVSALDVSVQAQIINLLQSLKTEFNLTMILISHDLSVVHHMADRIGVMYHGHLVELGPCEAIFTKPAHPYTQMLLNAILSPYPEEATLHFETNKPDLEIKADTGGGCVFHSRCKFAKLNCSRDPQSLQPIGFNQFSACAYAAEIAAEVMPSALKSPFSQNVEKRFVIFNQFREALETR